MARRAKSNDSGDSLMSNQAVTLRQKLDLRMTMLDTQRWSWWVQWRELASFISPRLARFLEMPNEGNRGSQKNQRIIDNTATIASQRFGAGLLAGMASPARPWFQLRVGEINFLEGSSEKVWLDDLEKRMYDVFAGSNFYRSMGTACEDIGVFGTTAMMLYEDYEDVIRCYPFAIGQYYCAVNERLEVDTLARKSVWNVEMLVGEFGLENCSEEVQRLYKMNNLDTEFLIAHMVCPNAEQIMGRNGVDGMPWVEYYWEYGRADGKFLRKKGFFDKPFVAARWNVTGNDAYGRGPGMDAIGDVRQLQVEQKRKAQLIDKLVNPPMVADQSLKNEPATSIPGGVTYIANGAGSVGFKPAYEVHPQGLAAITADLQTVQQRIRDAFFQDLFMAISQLDTVRTATEIAIRKDEKMLMLGPALDRLNDELLTVSVMRLFGIMVRKGLLPPNTPESLQGKQLKVEFVSVLAQAQKATATTSIERLFGFAGNLVAVIPGVLDNLNTDAAIEEYADALGVPAKVVRPKAEVDAMRAAQQQKQNMEQALAAGTVAAQGAKTLSETETGAGQNALQMMLGR
jgi:hypothetical protein